VLVTGAAQPYADLRAMLDYARRNPGRVGTGSTESLSSFIGQELARRANVEMADVQYRSGGQLMNDIVAGHLPVGWTSTASAMPHMQTGRVRVLAVSTATRTPFFPDVPTAQEQGVADFDLAGWVGLYGPAGLPDAVVQRLQEALTRAFADPTLQQRFTAMGIEPDLRPAAGLMQAAQREDRLWAAAAAAGHIKKEQ
jgi:tripartite-type tricarboxylate transporter receptor subunit TctC